MKFLITGGCGFVGSNVAARLLGEKEVVMVCDRLARTGSQENLTWLRSLGPLEFVSADVSVASEISAVIEKFRPDVIFHLAGQVAMTTSMANPRLDFETNVVGSFNLLEAVRLFCPEAAVIYASSNKVYGEMKGLVLEEGELRYNAPDWPQGIDESFPLDFQTPYGCSKGAADQYMLDYARVFGLRTAVFRHSTIYGGRQFATFDQGWVGWFCRQAVEISLNQDREPFTIAGNGKQVRDLLFVEDAVDAYFAAAQHIDRAWGQAFNIGGGMANSSSLLELFRQLEELEGVRLRYEEKEWRYSDQLFFVADNRKAKRILNWSPRVGKRDGVAKMLEWTKALSNPTADAG